VLIDVYHGILSLLLCPLKVLGKERYKDSPVKEEAARKKPERGREAC
jgi:hypothetical protein